MSQVHRLPTHQIRHARPILRRQRTYRHHRSYRLRRNRRHCRAHRRRRAQAGQHVRARRARGKDLGAEHGEKEKVDANGSCRAGSGVCEDGARVKVEETNASDGVGARVAERRRRRLGSGSCFLLRSQCLASLTFSPSPSSIYILYLGCAPLSA